ncbi:MAG TPA: heme exporter protein CcmB [Gemmatimonadaceae bacterium]|nr:heme exporter protein CcmB [Gemmatimonadaceae bacterium]
MSPDALRPPGLVAASWIVAKKDLAVELRTKSAFLSVLVFALLGLVIFFFAWDPTAVPSMDLAPGVLWVTFTFAGLLGLHRSFGLEVQDRAIDALLASPVEREAIYLGKAIANTIFVAAVLLVAVPATAIFYNLEIGRALLALGLVALLAAVGLVAIGTLFSAMAVNTRMAELLLPMLSLPFFVPIVLTSAQASTQLLAGRPFGEALPWLKILLAFDIVFAVACTVAFPHTLEE